MATLTEAQARASLALTNAFKAEQNRKAAELAALVALYYRQKVVVEDPESVQAWLDIMIPRLISRSDTSAREAAAFYRALRRLEVPAAAAFTPLPALGAVNAGVEKSLKSVGPFDYMNKMRVINSLDISPLAKKAALADAKQITSEKLAAATVRHAQAGGRQTIHENSARDAVALGWIRVTRARPCAFCAMLASRGIHYRAFDEGSFDLSDSRFTGEGDAKVHDECGCAMKAVFVEEDPVLDRNQQWIDMWERWGAGGGDAALRFRRAYDHWLKTGDYMSFEEANEGLRAA